MKEASIKFDDNLPSLKKCPFCNGRAAIMKHEFCGASTTYGVKCCGCQSESWQFYPTKRMAVESWNRRDSYESDNEACDGV